MSAQPGRAGISYRNEGERRGRGTGRRNTLQPASPGNVFRESVAEWRDLRFCGFSRRHFLGTDTLRARPEFSLGSEVVSTFDRKEKGMPAIKKCGLLSWVRRRARDASKEKPCLSLKEPLSALEIYHPLTTEASW
jgi:hypothetical protein